MSRRSRPFRALPTPLLAILLVTAVALPAAAQEEGVSQEAANTRIAQQFTEEVYNQQMLDKIPDYVAADFVDRSPGAPPGPHGPDFVRKQADQSFAGMPDLTFELLRTVAEGDLVTMHWKAVGTASAELAGGAAEGKRIELQGISIFRMQDGKIAESWDLVDRLSLLQQAGYRILPPAAPAAAPAAPEEAQTPDEAHHPDGAGEPRATEEDGATNGAGR
ncbi:MAG TPA: ester cyclase [Thermoanaerobaculia bacterium]|nr:ester cyclase [Thermoanaerobaculia bacterium]